MSKFPPTTLRQSKGFTLMELLVVIAIILVLAAIAFPVYTSVRQRSNKAVALNAMRQLSSAASTYSAQNDGELPREDSKGTDDWIAAADPLNVKAWYNALPKILGQKSVGEYANFPRDYYTKTNLLYIPGALYPENDKKLVLPLFAIAINTKLQRKDADGNKAPVRYMQISNPAKTVLFLEQGLPDESKSVPTQNKYDGSCKGSGRSFVGRYGGQGVLTFVDGHSELHDPKDVLTETGRFPFPPEGIHWTRSADEDPNK
ncbi:MAG: type II secretion system protein [Verrucomicrobiaceae bacterium]|nr:MAG: type II secretion system protein [Verrucomicrobiaceae bacterium]